MVDPPHPTHDATKTLTVLRDHLARHDKPIAFFFGAGTSCAVRVRNGDEQVPLVPAVPELTAKCKARAADLGDSFSDAWAKVETLCEESGKDRYVESILSRLRTMLSAVGSEDRLCGLDRDQIATLEESVRKTIADVVSPDLNLVPSTHPHRKFARWLLKTSRRQPVEIFTVNYDVLIENSLEAENIPVFDGFVGCYEPFFHAESVRRRESAPGAGWVRLWKMHGSITWRRTKVDERPRIIRGQPDTEGEMIYPSFDKYDESRQLPYSAFTDRLSRFLEQDDALLVVAGFSFGDEHINNLIFNALETNPRTHVYALQYTDPDSTSQLSQRAQQRSNMLVCGPKVGIIGGRTAAWAPQACPSYMDVAFQVETEAPTPQEENEPQEETSVGQMNLGDFAVFCDFLESMHSEADGDESK